MTKLYRNLVKFVSNANPNLLRAGIRQAVKDKITVT